MGPRRWRDRRAGDARAWCRGSADVPGLGEFLKSFWTGGGSLGGNHLSRVCGFKGKGGLIIVAGLGWVSR